MFIADALKNNTAKRNIKKNIYISTAPFKIRRSSDGSILAAKFLKLKACPQKIERQEHCKKQLAIKNPVGVVSFSQKIEKLILLKPSINLLDQ